jgi:hypothetical protein|tara:strand:+ start:407 stop:808 length:402 start_codon:yes stop_codon:yes gene_type:complete
MASKGTWSVVFDDKTVVKKTDDFANNPTGYAIDDSVFWNQSKFNNIWAIQYQTGVTSDEVEYRDETPHSSYADANLGDFQEFINRFDAAHLAKLQSLWDQDVIITTDSEGNEIFESESDQIARKGARPTSYSS